MPRVLAINTPEGDVRHIQIMHQEKPLERKLFSPSASYPIRYAIYCLLSICFIFIIVCCCLIVNSATKTSSTPIQLFSTSLYQRMQLASASLTENIRSYKNAFSFPSVLPSFVGAASQCELTVTSNEDVLRMRLQSIEDIEFDHSYNVSEDYRNLSLDMLIPSQGYTASDILDPWYTRLSPLYVEPAPEYALLRFNGFLMSGLGHAPPFYSGLPCITEVDKKYTNGSGPLRRRLPRFDKENCVHDILQPVNGRFWYLKVTTVENSSIYTEFDIGTKPETLARITTQLEENVQQWNVHPTNVSLISKLQLLQKLSVSFERSHVFNGLESCSKYTFKVQLHNITHITEPFQTLQFVTLPAEKLYDLERQRVTSYLNHITHPNAIQVPLLSLYLKPTSLVASHRQAAPFESIEERCSPKFHKWIKEYRQFHEERITVFSNTNNETHFYNELTSTKMIISIPKSDSGLTDRTNAISSLFLMSALSQRILLLDDAWLDVYWLFTPSLHLRRSLIAPLSYHRSIRDAYWTTEIGNPTTVGPDEFGPFSNDYDLTHPYPLTFYTSMRGVTIELLTKSGRYSPFLKGLNLTVESIAGCTWHSLWVPRLSALILDPGFDPIISTLLHKGVTGIGIQIRTLSDKAFTSKSVHWRLRPSDLHTVSDARALHELRINNANIWLQCAKEISDDILSNALVNQYTNDSRQIVEYLLSDITNVRISALALYGKQYYDANNNMRWPSDTLGVTSKPPFLVTAINDDAIAHSTINPPSVHKRILISSYALTEQFIFQLCHFHIVSRQSGFGRVPSYLAIRALPLYVIDQAALLENISCKANSSNATQPLQVAALDWSKV